MPDQSTRSLPSGTIPPTPEPPVEWDRAVADAALDGELAEHFAPGGLADTCPLAVMAIDPSLRTVGWNRAAEALFGWAPEEMLGEQGLVRLVPTEKRQEVSRILARVLNEGAPRRNVNANLTRDGRLIMCEWHNAILRGEDGAPAAIIAMGRDVTREIRSECEKERLQEIATAANTLRDLDDIVGLARTAMLEVGGFDRVGIWLGDETGLRGTWGTDEERRLRDERSLTAAPDTFGKELQAVLSGRRPHVVGRGRMLRHAALERPRAGQPVFAAMGLVARGRTVGVVFADNHLTGRSIREGDLRTLVPFCQQIAVTIANVELLNERERRVARRQRNIEVSAAINQRLELDEMLLLLRDALVESDGFDRAGIWLLEGGVLRGTWGTDEALRLRDERDMRIPIVPELPEYEPILTSARPYVIHRTRQLEIPGHEDLVPKEDLEFGVLGLRARGQLVGIAFVDNLVSGRAIRPAQLEEFLPLVEHAAVAVLNARLLGERQRMLERQRRLAEISTAINASLELNEVLRLVRDAIVDVGGFDRAGVFQFDGHAFVGAWGTDLDGRARDERYLRVPSSRFRPQTRALIFGTGSYFIEDSEVEALPDGRTGITTRRAMIALRAAGEVVGAISVDNFLSGRPLTQESVEALLPFAEEAAVAIRNASLIADRQRQIERQRRLATLAAAISARTSLNDVLYMVHQAILEAGGFDRAAVFVLDPQTGDLNGAWGTDRDGKTVDISGFSPCKLRPDWPMARVMRSEIPYYLSADMTADLNISPDHHMHGVHHHAVVPLRAGSEIIGAVGVDNLLRDAPITEEDVALLIPFAEQAAVAILNSRTFEDLNRAQDALVRSERLRALGELAGGVAHNINNLLTAVLGYSEMIQQEPGVAPQVAHFARIIERAGLDGAEIVRRVQQFAQRETATATAPVDLAQLAREAIDLTRPAWQTQPQARGATIHVITEAPGSAPAVGVASELREVIVNLIKNAAEAMPDGGTMWVRARTEGDRALVEVQDTGVGMDDATRDRVFEPFFTTKGRSLGTGLGLSLVWGIAAQHHGHVGVETAPGKGSTFTLALPAPPAATGGEPRRGGQARRLDGLRVLIVEDETFVCESLARTLVSRGARIEMAEQGAEALEWLASHADECDLVLSDHGMPGITGLELLARVREAYPRLRRVLLSGWGPNPPGGADTSAAEVILSKPARQAELVETLVGLMPRAAAAAG